MSEILERTLEGIDQTLKVVKPHGHSITKPKLSLHSHSIHQTSKPSKRVPLEVRLKWEEMIKGKPNKLNLSEDLIQVTLDKDKAPAMKFKGGRWLGRYLVPLTNIVFNPKDQPRDKKNDVNHVDDLSNLYELIGYDKKALPMMGTLSEGNPTVVDGFAGFHRTVVFSNSTNGQSFYIVDIYEFDSPLDRRIARSRSNHHKRAFLPQTINDYVKEVVNAVNDDECAKTETAISQLAHDLAEGDKTEKQIERIIKNAINMLGSVYAVFRTYSSSTSKNADNTLRKFLANEGIVTQGIKDRSDEELIEQGYISYCAAEGDNKSTWARAISNGQRLGIPVWVFGYASTRVVDLKSFREQWIKEFKETKSLFIDWACDITGSSLEDGICEDDFVYKVGGFLPQHGKADNTNGGKPTEVGLVDVNGNSIVFDPDGQCLTEKTNG